MATKTKPKKRCEFCGREYTPKRSDQKYHSNTCRVRAHRAREMGVDDVFFHASWSPQERAQYHELANSSSEFAWRIAVIARKYGGDAARDATAAAWSASHTMATG